MPYVLRSLPSGVWSFSTLHSPWRAGLTSVPALSSDGSVLASVLSMALVSHFL